MLTRIPTKFAAHLLQKSDDFIRWGLQQQRLPIGAAVQTSANRWSYHISAAKLSEYVGIDEEGLKVIFNAWEAANEIGGD